MMRERPRILLDALAYEPGDGGFATAVRDLCATCASLREIDFVVACHRAHETWFASRGLATTAVRFPRKLRFFAPLLMLSKVARRTGADAVHCEISALPAGLGVPGSVTVHDLFALRRPNVGGSGPGKRLMTYYWTRLFPASLRRAKVVKAISETTAADVCELVDADIDVAVVRPRIDPPSPPWRTRRWPAADEPLRLLFLGSVVPRKNLPFLLEALLLVGRPWTLQIAGNLWWGTGDVRLDANPHVRLHGPVTDARREALFRSSHALVLPSVYEGFGYPAAEAMARDRLALTSDIAAFREYVPEGCRFAIDDPAALADLIDALDADAYQRLVGEGRRSVDRFDADTHLAGHRRLFERLLGVSESPATTAEEAA